MQIHAERPAPPGTCFAVPVGLNPPKRFPLKAGDGANAVPGPFRQRLDRRGLAHNNMEASGSNRPHQFPPINKRKAKNCARLESLFLRLKTQHGVCPENRLRFLQLGKGVGDR